MRTLHVYIEINGESVYVGDIAGNSADDAQFTYAETYLADPAHRAISLSLPLEERSFDPQRTRNYYEGLLPEGFTRRSVAEWMHADAGDYLSMIAGLGRECLGAVRIVEDGAETVPAGYQPLSAEEVRQLAREGATQSAELVTRAHLSLTGASGKVGLYLDERTGSWYLPVGTAPSTHIVKQSHVRYRRIVVNEQLCLLTAARLGLEIPESHILESSGRADEDILFATRRYDRVYGEHPQTIDDMPVPFRLHQEDLAQALDIPALAKYERPGDGYLNRVTALIRDYSADPIQDQLRIWDLCIYNYLIGNTDNHIKNLSLLYSPDLRAIRLAPAYDLVSTVIYRDVAESMSVAIDGHLDLHEISRASYGNAAAASGLGRAMVLRQFDALAERLEGALYAAVEELTSQGYPEAREMAEQILRKGGIANC